MLILGLCTQIERESILIELIIMKEYGISSSEIDNILQQRNSPPPRILEEISPEDYVKKIKELAEEFKNLPINEKNELRIEEEISCKDLEERFICKKLEELSWKVPEEIRCFFTQEKDQFFCSLCGGRARNFICQNEDCSVQSYE